MQLELEIDLQRIVTLKIGQWMWQTPRVNRTIEELFYPKVFILNATNRRESWRELTSKILQDFKRQLLPTCLKRELLYIVEHIGEELYSWHEFVAKSNESIYKKYDQKLDYPKHHYWMSNGRIDVRKIIDKNWTFNLNSHNILAVYNIACRCGLEAHKVDDIWRTMTRIKPQRLQRERIFAGETYAKAYYTNLRDRDIQIFARTLRLIMEERLIKPFVENGYAELLRILWPKLQTSRKDRKIVELCERALELWCECTEFMMFERKEFEEIVVFLFKQLSVEQRRKIYIRRIDILLRLLSNYLRRDLLSMVVREYCGDVNEDKCRVISEFFIFIVDCVKSYGDDSVYNEILRIVWNDMPMKMKLNVDSNRISQCFENINLRIIVEKEDLVMI